MKGKVEKVVAKVVIIGNYEGNESIQERADWLNHNICRIIEVGIQAAYPGDCSVSAYAVNVKVEDAEI